VATYPKQVQPRPRGVRPGAARVAAARGALACTGYCVVLRAAVLCCALCARRRTPRTALAPRRMAMADALAWVAARVYIYCVKNHSYKFLGLYHVKQATYTRDCLGQK
jgi:hypothetical protein